MPKKKFICKNCGKEYESYKGKSKFCSVECRKSYNNVLCNCNNCGKQMIVYRNKIEAIEQGKHKNIFCSKECANNFQITLAEKVCEYCGRHYKITNAFKNIQRFCSRECYNKWNREKSIYYVEKICEYCGKTFTSSRPDQIFCSNNCKNLSQRNRKECVCEFCGKTFERIVSEVDKNTHHYCSNLCRKQASNWNEKEISILRKYYGKISNSEIQKMLPRDWSIPAIRAKSQLLGLGTDRKWTVDEENILKENYSKVSLNTLFAMLPNRSFSSIRGKAKAMGLLSKFYLDAIYTNEEIDFLKSNYVEKDNYELAKILNRTPLAIAQKLYLLDLHRPVEIHKDAYRNLMHFTRNRLRMWRDEVREQFNYTCQVTGKRSNIVVHHIRGFNLLFNETIDVLNFPLYDSLTEYSDEQLNLFIDKFFEIQESYNQYICITETIHKLFHSIYGYGNNTLEQWNDFINNYKAEKIA